jgi:iron complex outermembrane receptor protein
MTRGRRTLVVVVGWVGLRASTAVAAEPPAVATPVAPYETVVTAAPRTAEEPELDRAAAASVVLPAESPRARDDLGDLLAEVPGVTVTRSGGVGDFATITMRGSNPEEVRIYIDGVPVNVAAGGSVDLSTLPIGDVERVEVYRGATPIAFGESALGGIVSITTRTPGAPRASARAGGGSFGTVFGDASVGGGLGPLRLYAGLHGLHTDGNFPYRSDNGTVFDPADDATLLRQNNGLRQLDGVLRAVLDLPGRREIGLGVMGIWREHGLSGQGIFNTLSAPSIATARALGYAGYESRDDLGMGSRLRGQLFFSGLRDDFTDPAGAVGPIPAVTHDTTQSFGSTVMASKAVSSWARATAVTEGRRETFHPVNELDPMPVGVPAERLVGTAGLELDLWWRRIDLEIIPSARMEVVRDTVSGRDLLFARHRPASAPITRALPLARLGLVRPLGPWMALKGNAGRYARVPSFRELYGNNGVLLGNPILLPEIGWNADAGASFHPVGHRVKLDGRVALFGALVEDLIEWEMNAQGQARADNVSRARIWGLEQELRLAVGRRVLVTGQVTYTDARDAGEMPARRGRQLPGRPRYHGYLRPELRHLFNRSWVSAGVYLEGDLRAGTFGDSNNQWAVPSRLLMGAGVNVDMPRAGMRLAVSGRNLGDSRTFGESRDFDTINYPLPGRSLFLSLMWSGDFRRPENANNKE